MHRKLVVFGITMANGGIENLMRYFVFDCKEKNKFSEILLVSSYPSIVYENEYKESGVNVIHIPSRNKGNLYKKAILSIFNSLNSNDLIYLNVSTFCNWRLFSLAKRTKCNIVIHGHNAHVKNLIKKMLHFVGRNLYSKIGFKIAVSEECSKFMFGGHHDVIIPNGIPSKNYTFSFDDRQNVRNELLIKEEQIVVGCVGRISHEKNQIYLAKLAKFYPKFLFLFLGDFMNDGYKKRVISRSSQNCMFVGTKKNVGPYLSAMDALIVPSKREAFPLSVVEGITNGLPIFCHKNLDNKLPTSILKSENCKIIKNDELDVDIIKFSHLLRNSNNVVCTNEYDIVHFLDAIHTFLFKEVLNG